MVKDDIHYWLALKQIPRLSVTKKLALVKTIGLVELFTSPVSLTVFNLTAKQIAAIKQPDWNKIEAILKACHQCGSQLIGFDNQHYPALLKQIYDPPLILYVQGDATLLSDQQLAILGSRSASIGAKETTKKFASTLSRHNIVITSGLATGIDGFAHQAVIETNGKTIAVVATGLDSVYPPRHKKLAQDIIQHGGAIISEFPPGTPAKAGHFPKRNRIISGLSKGVLVVEAALQSGSLITARTALEQNREVFAIPGNIANPQVKGCHWLIKQGAKLVDDVADILNELDFTCSLRLDNQADFSVQSALNDKNIENNVAQGLFIDPLLASVGDEITPIEIVVSRSELPVEEVLSRLTVLELRGLVSAVPGGYQRLIKG